jgi:hypothetical protein
MKPHGMGDLLMKITNYKLQITNKLQSTNYKLQNKNSKGSHGLHQGSFKLQTMTALIKSFCGGSRGAVFSKRAPLAAGGKDYTKPVILPGGNRMEQSKFWDGWTVNST